MNKQSSKPWVLGIASSHNGGACLLHGEVIVVAIQEERLSRIKRADHPAAGSSLAIDYCLQYAGITPRDLSFVACCAINKHGNPFDDLSLNPTLRLISNAVPFDTITHHLGHAFGAFVQSGFREAGIVVIDGSGSPLCDLSEGDLAAIPASRLRLLNGNYSGAFEIVSVYSGSSSCLRPIKKYFRINCGAKKGMPYFRSLGDMYSAIGYQIFGSTTEGPGKVMGLAPYGRRSIDSSSFFDADPDWLTFKEDVPDQYTHSDRWPNRQEEYTNLACSVQNALEFGASFLLEHAIDLLGRVPICYAGGVALNSVCNELLTRIAGKNMFVMPAAEDSGTAIGAAYYGLLKLTGLIASKRILIYSPGRVYSTSEIEGAIQSTPFINSRSSSNVAYEAAQILAKGKIVGLHDGGAELGPRALGSRSILADPRDATIKEQLNTKIKFRESFRPFAPVILKDSLLEWFDTTSDDPGSPFMLRVIPFRSDKRDKVPAVVHVDGTGRVQTIEANDGTLLSKILMAFYGLTGTPLLLNTSLNIAGDPISESPTDALWTLLFTGLNYVVIGHNICTCKEHYTCVLDLTPVIVARQITTELFPNTRSSRAADITRPPQIHCYRNNVFSEFLIRQRVRGRACTVCYTDDDLGEIVTVFDDDLSWLLQNIDGIRSGWALLEEAKQLDSSISSSCLAWNLNLLRKGRVVRFLP